MKVIKGSASCTEHVGGSVEIAQHFKKILSTKMAEFWLWLGVQVQNGGILTLALSKY